MEINVLSPEDTKTYKNFYPVYEGKEEIIIKAAEHLNFAEIKTLVKYLENFDIEKFKNRECYLQIGEYGYESLSGAK